MASDRYENKYNDTNAYRIFVKVNKFPSSIPDYGITPFTGNSNVYIRVFTGLTEQQALDTNASAGGAWVSGLTWYSIRFYSSGVSQENGYKVYARVEAYWPGLEQKFIKYSKMPVICGYGDNYGYDVVGLGYYDEKSSIEIYLNGSNSNQYITYGDAMKSFRKINNTINFPRFLSSGVTENQEITVSTASSSSTFYYQTTSASTLYNSSLSSSPFTATPSEEKYKTIPEIAFNRINWASDSDEHSYVWCTSEYTETECPDDSCPTDCDRVCNCDSETYCYGEMNVHPCGSHTCTAEIADICNCFSADDNNGCATEYSPYDFCNYQPIQCIYGRSENSCYFDIPFEGTPLTAMTARIEGQFLISSNSRYDVFFVTSGSSAISDYTNYMRLSTYGKNNDYLRGGISCSGGTPSSMLSGITYYTDVDITFGNNWILDNDSGQYVYTATTNSSSVIGRICRINGYAFKIKRIRLYNGESILFDMSPYAAQCGYGDNMFSSKYGLYDQVSGRFYQPSGDILSGLVGCTPIGYDNVETPVDCIFGNASSGLFSIPVMSGITNLATKMNFKGQILGDNETLNSNISLIYTSPSSAQTNQIISFRALFSNRGDDYFTLGYSGTTTIIGYSASRKPFSAYTDVDLTISNLKVADATSGNVFSYREVTKSIGQDYLTINLGYLKFEELIIYSGDTQIIDLKPYAVGRPNDSFTPALKDIINGVTYPVSSTLTGISTCPIPVSGSPITSGYLLKCMNGSAVHYQHTYNQGETIDRTAITAPSKVGYTFTGWNPAIPSTMPGEDFTTEAQFSINSHTITYYLKDGEHGSTSYVQYTSQTYNYGATIVPPTITPGSGYEFSGWSLSGNTTMPDSDLNSYGDVHVYVPEYTLTFYSGSSSWGSSYDCQSFSSVTYHAGDTISYPSTYRYCMLDSGWKTSCNGSTDAPSTMPANNLNVYVTYTYETFTVHWMAGKTDGNYTEYDSQTAEYHDYISYSDGPDLTNYAPSGYFWSGWGTGSVIVECEDLYIYSHFYPEQTILYTLTYVVDGSVYSTENYAAGSSVTAIAKPTDSTYCATYSDWSGVPSTMPSNDVTATTTSSPVQYTITYMADEEIGTNQYHRDVITVDTYGCGESVSEVTYSSTHRSCGPWSPSIPSTMPNYNITAICTCNYVTYTATFYMADGTYYGSTSGTYGSTIEYPSIYNKTGYDVSWPSTPTTFTDNVSIYAIETLRSHTVYWYVNGSVYHSETVNYGESVPTISAPSGYYWETSAPSTMPDADVYIYAAEQGCSPECNSEIICTCEDEIVTDEYCMTVTVFFDNQSSYNGVSCGVNVRIGDYEMYFDSGTLEVGESSSPEQEFCYPVASEGTTVSVTVYVDYNTALTGVDTSYSNSVRLDRNGYFSVDVTIHND